MTKIVSHNVASSLPRALLARWVLPLLLGLSAISPVWAAAPKSESRDSPFIGQNQIAVTVLQAYRPSGVFQVDIGILVLDPTQRARAASLQPVLRDAWRRTTQDFANNHFTPGRVPDAVLLGQRLQAATDQILGVGNARLLLTSLVVR